MEVYDPVAGYALREEAKHNNHLFAENLYDKECEKHRQLLESLDLLCEMGIMKNPIEKIKRYKKVIEQYYLVKKT